MVLSARERRGLNDEDRVLAWLATSLSGLRGVVLRLGSSGASTIVSSSIPADGPDIHCWGASRRGIPRTTELGRLPWLLADGPSVLPGFGCCTTLEPNLDSRLFGGFSAAWFTDGRGWVDETARDGPADGWERVVATLGAN